MAKHDQAELMLQYAKDALETSKPWKLWECRNRDGNWVDAYEHPRWDSLTEYRRKPQPICKVEGRNVFVGDQLWQVCNKVKITVASCKTVAGVVIILDTDGRNWTSDGLSWTEPYRAEKTVYQWAYNQNNCDWKSSAHFYETEKDFRESYEIPDSIAVKRLNYTALEVPNESR